MVRVSRTRVPSTNCDASVPIPLMSLLPFKKSFDEQKMLPTSCWYTLSVHQQKRFTRYVKEQKYMGCSTYIKIPRLKLAGQEQRI